MDSYSHNAVAHSNTTPPCTSRECKSKHVARSHAKTHSSVFNRPIGSTVSNTALSNEPNNAPSQQRTLLSSNSSETSSYHENQLSYQDLSAELFNPSQNEEKPIHFPLPYNDQSTSIEDQKQMPSSLAAVDLDLFYELLHFTDTAYQRIGKQGQSPLILHRPLKPQNGLQLTPLLSALPPSQSPLTQHGITAISTNRNSYLVRHLYALKQHHYKSLSLHNRTAQPPSQTLSLLSSDGRRASSSMSTTVVTGTGQPSMDERQHHQQGVVDDMTRDPQHDAQFLFEQLDAFNHLYQQYRSSLDMVGSSRSKSVDISGDKVNDHILEHDPVDINHQQRSLQHQDNETPRLQQQEAEEPSVLVPSLPEFIQLLHDQLKQIIDSCEVILTTPSFQSKSSVVTTRDDNDHDKDNTNSPMDIIHTPIFNPSQSLSVTKSEIEPVPLPPLYLDVDGSVIEGTLDGRHGSYTNRPTPAQASTQDVASQQVRQAQFDLLLKHSQGMLMGMSTTDAEGGRARGDVDTDTTSMTPTTIQTRIVQRRNDEMPSNKGRHCTHSAHNSPYISQKHSMNRHRPRSALLIDDDDDVIPTVDGSRHHNEEYKQPTDPPLQPGDMTRLRLSSTPGMSTKSRTLSSAAALSMVPTITSPDGSQITSRPVKITDPEDPTLQCNALCRTNYCIHKNTPAVPPHESTLSSSTAELSLSIPSLILPAPAKNMPRTVASDRNTKKIPPPHAKDKQTSGFFYIKGSNVDKPRYLWSSDLSLNVFSWQEIRQHNQPNDCWLVVNGMVYEVTAMLPSHPAGIECIVRYGGTDATRHFEFHPAHAQRLWKKYHIGYVEGATPSSCVII